MRSADYGNPSASPVERQANEAAMPTPHAQAISLSDEQRQSLRRLARAHSTPQSLALRGRIVLRAADEDKPTNLRIAFEFGCDSDTVAAWRKRFAKEGLAGLPDRPRSGRPPVFSPLAEAPRPRTGND
jgi:transposase-like protein